MYCSLVNEMETDGVKGVSQPDLVEISNKIRV